MISPDLSRYRTREVVVSAVINGVMSALFAWLVFGGQTTLNVWDRFGFVFDFVPQGFMIGLMGTLVPALLARRAFGKQPYRGPIAVNWSLRSIVSQAFMTAMMAALAGTLVAALTFAVTGIASLAFAQALLLKVLYGVLVGGVATSRVLSRLFASFSEVASNKAY